MSRWEALDLNSEIVSMGTSRVLRVRRVGTTYFAENMQQRRTLGADGVETVEEEWKIVAVAKADFAKPGLTPRDEIHDWVARANIEVWQEIAKIQRTKRESRKEII